MSKRTARYLYRALFPLYMALHRLCVRLAAAQGVKVESYHTMTPRGQL